MDLNFTNKSNTRTIGPGALINLYYNLLLTAGIYLSVLAVITTVANGLLLLTIYKNTKSFFRKPVTILIAALAVADLLNGFLIDPLYSCTYFSLYFKSISQETYLKLAEVSMLLAVVTMNSSYLLVLLLSCTQLIAITFPYKHKSMITSRSVSIAVGVILVYSVSFALSCVVGMPENVFQKIEVFLHMTGITVVLIAAYVCLQISYTRQRRRFRRLVTDSRRQSRVHHEKKSTTGHRKFLMVNILLIACLLVTSLPVTVIWYFRLYLFSQKTLNDSEMMVFRNASLIVDNFLFLKFLVDPFIYAWRMPKYRRAFKQTINECPNFLFNFRSNVARERANTHSSVRTLVPMFGHKRSSSRRSKTLQVNLEENVV